MQDISHIPDKLGQDRIIQSHLSPLVLDLFRAHALRGERISRHNAHQHKQQKSDYKQRQQGHTNPLERILNHTLRSSHTLTIKQEKGAVSVLTAPSGCFYFVVSL